MKIGGARASSGAPLSQLLKVMRSGKAEETWTECFRRQLRQSVEAGGRDARSQAEAASEDNTQDTREL
jgi:hypothetical protein